MERGTITREFKLEALRLLALLCLLFAFELPVSAQCRVGSGPDQGDGVPYCSQLPAPAPSAPNEPVWATRWGAIATADGVFGAVVGLASERKAEKAAMQQCKAKGGRNCGVIVSYYNQCAALAWGENGENAARGPYLNEVETTAMAGCSERSQNCKLYYSACSDAERVR